MIRDDNERDLYIGTVGIEVSRERNGCMGEEYITKEEQRSPVKLLKNEKKNKLGR